MLKEICYAFIAGVRQTNDKSQVGPHIA